MLEYARWKYILVAVVLVLGLVLASPNFFGSDDALQIARKDHAPVTEQTTQEVESYLKEKKVPFLRSYIDNGRLMVLFADVPQQLAASEAVGEHFEGTYITAMSMAPRTPAFLRALGLRPMSLGLDLRGGLYLLYQVDVNSSVNQLLEGYAQDARRALAVANIPIKDVTTLAVNAGGRPDAVRAILNPGTDVQAARNAVSQSFQGLVVTTVDVPGVGTAIQAQMTPAQVRERQDYAIDQTMTILRNRVNGLGVSEPIVQRQGVDRVSVQLPGVQNSAEVKNLLGRVATLEFRLEDTTHNAFEAAQSGHAPLGSKLYTHTRIGRPILLKREIIATGDQLTNASVENTQDGIGVNVRLDARAGENMLKTTKANLNKPMAVVLIEKHRDTEMKDGKPVMVDGKPVTHDVTDETVINDATIRGVFSNTFVITGLSNGEAHDLSLLLRSGSLATAIYPVEERVVGPTVGKDNIAKGEQALLIGMAAVFAFMAIYYKVFGMVADLVLLANVVLLTALLSALGGVALSLPGIAGIILTVGMAVDANVLIYERIREEIRKGVSPQAAIRAGFEKAFSAIADSNITTLIAGVVLWVFGTGPIRGFAVVLTFGIGTSMFTALMGSRALITLMYGGRRKLARLSI